MTLTEEYLDSIGMPDGLQQLIDDDIKEILENQEKLEKVKKLTDNTSRFTHAKFLELKEILEKK